MKQFAVVNRDLVIGKNGYTTIAGPAKVKQDLSIAVREPYGCDTNHPGWGSLLVEYVGRQVSDETEILIRSEITRIVSNYMVVQQEQMTQDALKSRITRFGAGEVVLDIEKILVRQDYDRYHVKVTVRTLGGEQVSLLGTVSA